ncbi:gamma-glutamyltransferase family protein [Evansella clarkii]|uniref:gamma-glutamyltransferase family protein n=1 Tax=Evansella clarkii TaxID=79879 RepID=UPI000B44D41F|nr:gamma-glutamyltransferase [Evansella clarkii]
MNYLRITNILAVVIFLGLVAYSYFEDEHFDPNRQPYSGGEFTERQEDSVEVAQDPAASEEEREHVGVYGVSAAHPLAVEAGMRVMEEYGGNAVDAAIAISFVLNVVEPYGSGIGGGGSMIVHEPENGAVHYDYRELVPESGAWGTRAAAVPGMVDGMETLYQDYGSVNWEDLLQPAIDHAYDGFLVDENLHQRIANSARWLEFTDGGSERYYPEGRAIGLRDNLVQEELGRTLELIRDNGAAGFYEGEIGEAIAQHTGFQVSDLAAYSTEKRAPATAQYNGFTIHGGAPPTSGVVLAQALQIAETMDLSEILDSDLPMDDGLKLGDIIDNEDWQHVYLHLISEITKTVYADRLDTLGDPLFEDVDYDALTAPEYTAGLIDEIDFDSIDVENLWDSPAEINDSRHTTHFVVVDKDGMMVSATNSLGEFFGAGLNIKGFFMNNQQNNFSENPESPNFLEPGKRPRSFVSPTIFEEEGRAVLGIGTPGGTRIPAMLFQTIMQYEYGLHQSTGEPLTLQEAITRPRFYADGDVMYVEQELPQSAEQALNNMGYAVRLQTSPLYYGGIQGLGIELDEHGYVQRMFGGGDPRRDGAWQIATEEEGAGEIQQED